MNDLYEVSTVFGAEALIGDTLQNSNQTTISNRRLIFLGEGKTGAVPGEKPLNEE